MKLKYCLGRDKRLKRGANVGRQGEIAEGQVSAKSRCSELLAM